MPLVELLVDFMHWETSVYNLVFAYHHSHDISCADENIISLIFPRLPHYISYSYFRQPESLIKATEPAVQVYKINDHTHPKPQGNVHWSLIQAKSLRSSGIRIDCSSVRVSESSTNIYAIPMYL